MLYNKYRCASKELFRNGILFLLIFPVVVGGCIWSLGLLSPIILISLAAIYFVDLIAFAWLFTAAWDKSLIVSENAVAFRSRLFTKLHNYTDIKDIILLADHKGQEFLRIRTNKKQYYLDEQYQPWDALLIDLENLARQYEIVSNLTD